MSTINEGIAHLAVPIESLIPYPGNPRRGAVRSIMDSLEANGQYRPIVVQASTRYVLAGNHTWQAARKLGWVEIAATLVDCDDEEAARIVAVDNRAADQATYDDAVLIDLLESLPDLDGTGFFQSDLDRMKSALDASLVFDGERLEERGGQRTNRSLEGLALVNVPPHQWAVSTGEFAAWVHDTGLDGAQEPELRRRLGLPGRPEAKVRAPKRKKVDPSTITQRGSTRDQAELVDVTTLSPHPLNPRQGDVGLIAESLALNGQYRPIVIDQDNRVLAGTHTWRAACALGWSHIDAVRVTVVDEAHARRILAVDNRAADLGVYDTEALASLLSALTALDGTGYDLDDLDEIRRQLEQLPPARGATVAVIVTCHDLDVKWRLPVSADDYDAWYEELVRTARYAEDRIRAEVFRRLGFGPTVGEGK